MTNNDIYQMQDPFKIIHLILRCYVLSFELTEFKLYAISLKYNIVQTHILKIRFSKLFVLVAKVSASKQIFLPGLHIFLTRPTFQ